MSRGNKNLTNAQRQYLKNKSVKYHSFYYWGHGIVMICTYNNFEIHIDKKGNIKQVDIPSSEYDKTFNLEDLRKLGN